MGALDQLDLMEIASGMDLVHVMELMENRVGVEGNKRTGNRNKMKMHLVQDSIH